MMPSSKKAINSNAVADVLNSSPLPNSKLIDNQLKKTKQDINVASWCLGASI